MGLWCSSADCCKAVVNSHAWRADVLRLHDVVRMAATSTRFASLPKYAVWDVDGPAWIPRRTRLAISSLSFYCLKHV